MESHTNKELLRKLEEMERKMVAYEQVRRQDMLKVMVLVEQQSAKIVALEEQIKLIQCSDRCNPTSCPSQQETISFPPKASTVEDLDHNLTLLPVSNCCMSKILSFIFCYLLYIVLIM